VTGLVSLLRPQTLVFVWTQCLVKNQSRDWGLALCTFVLDFFVLARSRLLSSKSWDDLLENAKHAAQHIATAEWRKRYVRRKKLAVPREPHLEELERRRAKAGRAAHRGQTMAELHAMLVTSSEYSGTSSSESGKLSQ
jgi:hypothetical protein